MKYLKFIFNLVFICMIFILNSCGNGSGSGPGTGTNPNPVENSTFPVITAFSLNDQAGVITNDKIAVVVPYGTNLTNLVGIFKVSAGSTVKVNGVLQTSGVTVNDFTHPLVYTVTTNSGNNQVSAKTDANTRTYIVTVTTASISDKAITTFSLKSPSSTVETSGIISILNIDVIMPAGTNITALDTIFTSLGQTVTVNGVIQKNGMTQDFTKPVTYTVTAADGTTHNYVVTVTVAPDSAHDIIAFSLNGVPGLISQDAHKEIIVKMPFGTNLNGLVATFITTGASITVNKVPQISGTTQNDFTKRIVYIVTAADGTIQTYTIVILISPDTSNFINAFSFGNIHGVINGQNIAVTVPFGTDLTELISTFTTTGLKVSVAGKDQINSTTPNDFTHPVTYTVTAADGSTLSYTVTVTKAPGSVKAITAFSIGLNKGIITGQNIVVQMPFGTDASHLIADFNTSGVKVSVAQIPQISGFTQNDFTHVVAYEVTAEDGSTTTYLVTVTVALSSAKAITTFSIAGATGVFDGFNIAVLVPHGTRLYTAVDFSTTGVGVTVNGVPQVTGTTAVDFTAPAIYTITAADGTTQNYIVTVTVAKSSAKSLTSFILADESGVITGQNIAVTVPFGTNLTTATATFATTGTHVFVGGIQQISEVTPNNFESNVSYVVTAADGSTATYTVTVIVSPQYVYVGNSGSNTISKYNINESNGQLTNPATFDSGGAGTINIVLDPSKKHLYSLNYTSGTISVFDINTSNGLLSQKYTISNGGERPLDMTFSSTGAFAFVTNQSFSSTGSITTYSVNASTGELTFIAKIGLIISSMSGSFNIKTDPTKSYVYIANRTNNIFPGYGDIEWFSINNSTGQLTPGGHFNDGMSFPADIVIAPSGNFSYILDSLIGNSNISTHEVNKATGAIENRFRNDRTNGSYSNHLTISPSGLFLYVNNLYSSTISMFSVNTATGILTSLGAVTAGTSPEILQLSTSGNYAYVTSNGNRTVLMYKVNPETGVLTALVPPTIATGSGPIGIVVK